MQRRSWQVMVTCFCGRSESGHLITQGARVAALALTGQMQARIYAISHRFPSQPYLGSHMHPFSDTASTQRFLS